LPSCIGSANHDFTREKRPAYSIGVKLSTHYESGTPGPVYYPDPRVIKTGRAHVPACHLAGRPKEYSLWATPGPGAYKPETHNPPDKPSIPAYTIAARHKELSSTTDNVGPNSYMLPSTISNKNFSAKIKTAPAFSIASRTKFNSITFGMDEIPTRLYQPKVEAIKVKPPSWTIIGRNYPPSSDDKKPGPSNYYAENVKLHLRSPPKVSMGIRHSEFCTTGLPAHQDQFD